MDNVILKDVGEIFSQKIGDPTKMKFLGINEKIDFAEKLNTNTMLRAGIGSVPKALIQASKEATITITPLFFSESIFADVNGTDVEEGTVTLPVWEGAGSEQSDKLIVSGGKVTLKGTPSSSVTTVTAKDVLGNEYSGSISGKVVTFTGSVPADGTHVTVIYNADLTGSIINLDFATFPKATSLYWHTVLWNPDTNDIYADVYLHLFKCVADGSVNLNLGTDKNANIPIKYQVVSKLQDSSMGQWISVPRAEYRIAPIITADITNNKVGQDIDLEFNDNIVWRENITDITVGGASIIGQYTPLAGKITIDSTAFSTANTYTIVIKSTGYPDVTVSQIITA